MTRDRITSVLHEVDPGSHVVHFYSDDYALASSVAEYALEGLGRGEGVVLITEPSHLEAVRRAFAARGTDPDAGVENGVRLLDAGTVLDRVMVDGRPAADRFAETVGGALQSALGRHAGVRVYGEMVDKLWRAGDVTGALALEELWNELARELPFTLYCAYRDSLVAGATDETALDATCRLHSSVVGDGALTPRTSTGRRFSADDTAPAAARAFVLAVLQSQDAVLVETAVLVVSELATNAIRHGGTAFSVTVSSLAHGVRIAVSDGHREPPVPRTFSEADPGGRGLHIVDALCRDWGTTRRYDGKVVWAELAR
jgi:anti-sigma regulatory factor (Ser/Thr protein kinase)